MSNECLGPPMWLLPRDERAVGLRDGRPLSNGIGVARADLHYARGADYRFPSVGDHLKLHFKLCGQSSISHDDDDFIPVEAGRIAILAQPLGDYKRERISTNARERSVTLICEREFAAGLLPANADLPGDLRHFLNGGGFAFASLPLPPQLRPIVEAILEPPVIPALQPMMIEAKALELFSVTLHQFLNTAGPAALVRRRDRDRIEHLRQLLETEPATPLSISELCRRLAWNETQMMQAFKSVTGTTIFGYRRRLRMERAREQLRDTDGSITEIALEAGYEHPSNFATAFRRTFGITPRDARQGARALLIGKHPARRSPT